MNQMQLMMYAIYCTQATDTTAFTKVSFESKFDRRYNTADAVEDALALLGLKFGLLEEKKDKFKFNGPELSGPRKCTKQAAWKIQ